MIAILLAVAASLFTLTYWYVHSFESRREALAMRWFSRGEKAMLDGKPELAIDDLRTALHYAPNDMNYRLRLAQALATAGHVNQAFVYFRNLWDAEPGNGLLNLELARLSDYLGKETAQNILAFRFANPLFEPLWNRRYVDCVTITAVEAVGVEHRGSYYDRRITRLG